MLQEMAEMFDESAANDSSARDTPSSDQHEADVKEKALVKTMNQFAWAIAAAEGSRARRGSK